MDVMFAFIAAMDFTGLVYWGLISDEFVISFVVSKYNIIHLSPNFRVGRC